MDLNNMGDMSTAQALETWDWTNMNFTDSEAIDSTHELHAFGWGNIDSTIGGPINTTQELDNNTLGSHFSDIADVGDGDWNLLALLTVILLKAPPKRTREWLPHQHPMSQLLTLDRLNVWFSKRCGIKEPRTSNDIEEAWQWIQTDHKHWTDYYLRDPAQADQAIEEVKKILRTLERRY